MLVSWILPKMNETTRPTVLYDTSGRLVFVRFLEELKAPKSPFEINSTFALIDHWIKPGKVQVTKLKYITQFLGSQNSTLL